ncbi:DUF4270 family protein [Rufibacter sp. LB8]|uniref:DUF4270 family protein n=1 Tax=Rufibacter sp. LB8 TaxID=2777781 RepID=UPI00178C6C34|nr:DUF4270 family protein [Rufibacter sp. LB8]
MNLRISKAAAALFLSSFLFSSCEDPTAIGLELQDPGSQIGTSFTDTATVQASTVLLKDNIVSLGGANTLVGELTDGELGTVTARAFTELSLNGTNITFEPNNGADSLVLFLDYGYSYGDIREPITLNVHELDEKIIDEATYNTTASVDYKPEVLGSVTFVPTPRATYNVVNAPGDTTKNLPVTIRVKLDTPAGKALAQRIMAESGKDPLKTQLGFTNLLKGLAIVPAANSNSVVGVQMASAYTRLNLHYKSTTANATKTHTFPTTNRYFNQILSTRAGTSLAKLTTHTDTVSSKSTNGLTYLQAGAGLVTKLVLPYINNFRKAPAGQPNAGQQQDLVINKAELVIPVKASSIDTAYFKLPPLISVVESNAINDIARTSGGFPVVLAMEGTGQPAILEYRNNDLTYVVNVTSYMQNVLYNRRTNNGLILYPSNITSDVGTPANFGQTVNRAIIEAQSQTDPARRIKLRLFYSVAK